MKWIELTQGKVALVDDKDYKMVAQRKWSALKPKGNGRAWYAIARQGAGKILMHRFILGLTGKKQVDHKNGDGLDNRRCNMRICSNGQNQHNRMGQGKKSKFKGVKKEQRQKDTWGARIKTNGKAIWLGTFRDEKQAAKAYDTAALKYFGEFALTNKMMGLL